MKIAVALYIRAIRSLMGSILYRKKHGAIEPIAQKHITKPKTADNLLKKLVVQSILLQPDFFVQKIF